MAFIGKAHKELIILQGVCHARIVFSDLVPLLRKLSTPSVEMITLAMIPAKQMFHNIISAALFIRFD
jgi:hypothetical protein